MKEYKGQLEWVILEAIAWETLNKEGERRYCNLEQEATEQRQVQLPARCRVDPTARARGRKDVLGCWVIDRRPFLSNLESMIPFLQLSFFVQQRAHYCAVGCITY
jgi:hypothetical protein